MKRDRYGYVIGTTAEDAAGAYGQGLDLFLAAQDGSEDAFNRAISMDPGFALARVGLTRVLQTAGRTKEAAQVMDHLAGMDRDGDAREQALISITGKLVAGNGPAAYAEIKEHIKSYPRDVLAIQPCCGVFGLIGFSGRAGRESEHIAFLASLAREFGEDWWFRTQLAFALSESGQLDRARHEIEEAFNANTSNAHAAHYFAHIYYERGESVEGIEFLTDWLKSYHRQSLLHCHLNWHAALWQLEQGDVDRAWKTIDSHVKPDSAWGPPINVLTDNVSFLLRAEITGATRRKDLWEAISCYASEKYGNPGLSFVDAHSAIAHAMAGNHEALEKLIRNSAGSASDQVSAVARAFSAFSKEEWQRAVDELVPIMSSHERLGGSRAQRDLLELTLSKALVELGRADEARRCLLMRRPRLFGGNPP